MSIAPSRLGISAESAAAADAEGVLSKRVVAELTAAGFPRYFAPAHLGGFEAGYEELFHAVATAAEHSASAAWCAVLWAIHGRYAARLPEQGRAEIWQDSPDMRISAGVIPPAGTARPVAGGWSVSGRWEFASGIEHAQWVLLASRPTDAEQVRVFAVRGTDIEVERTWDAIGLRATGSHTVRAQDLFVPQARSMTFEEMTRADPAPHTPRRQAVPAYLFGGTLMAAVALGAAQAAVADWTRRATTVPAGGKSPLSDTAAAVSLTQSSGELEAARLLLTEAVRRVDAGPTDEAAVARNMRDAAVGVSLLLSCVDRLLQVGGTASRAAVGTFHRSWRDVHTVSAHGALRLSTVAPAYARAVAAGDGS